MLQILVLIFIISLFSKSFRVKIETLIVGYATIQGIVLAFIIASFKLFVFRALIELQANFGASSDTVKSQAQLLLYAFVLNLLLIGLAQFYKSHKNIWLFLALYLLVLASLLVSVWVLVTLIQASSASALIQ